jgi:hypothetical protein
LLQDKLKINLKHKIEAHFDVQEDLIYLIKFGNWVIENYYDRDVIPLPKFEDTYIDLRGAYLDFALMRYRRCFEASQRGRIDVKKGKISLGEWVEIHDDELMLRANKVVAHAVLAAHSASLYIGSDLSISRWLQRPGVNRFDFENIVRLSKEWLIFVESEIEIIKKELQPLLTLVDISSNILSTHPIGSNVDIQSQRKK